jgi:PAS domain S-box-containing protein
MSRSHILAYRVPALLLAGLAGVFVGDAFTPLGVSVWLLYLPLVLATLLVEWPRAPWAVAACATLLLAITYFIKPPGIPRHIALVNRGIATVALWTSAALVYRVRRADRAQRDSEESLLFALETSRTGAWDLNLVDHTARRSLLHDRIFGYDELLREWTYEMFLEHVVPEDRARVDATFRKATAEQSDWSFECRIRRRDGEIRWIWAAGQHRDVVDGKPRRMAGIVQDITARMQAEEDLRESERRFRTLADNISQLAWMADESGWIHWYNRRWYEYTGTTFEHMAGWGWQGVHHPEHVERVVARWRRSHATGEPWEDTFPLRGADGAYRWFLSRALPVRDASDSIVGWFGTNTDVTELREAQQSLLALTRTLEERVQQRTAELEESNSALEAFGYSVSHDLRAPLRTMQGFARALLEDYGPRLDDDGRDYATRITTGAARMDQLIQDLLAYSRLSRAEIKAEPVSLDSVLRMAERQLEPVLLEHRGTLTIRSPLPRVLGHETTLVQVFVNLLSNALKFVARGARSEVEVWSERRAGRVRVFVRDNGIGIQPEHQERIFAVFERLHGSETYPGTGIGLAIVKKGIERLRGRSGVDSAPGRGSTFWIELPEPAPVAERTTWTYPGS